MPVNFDTLPMDRQWDKWESTLSALALLDNRDKQGQLSGEALLRRSPSGVTIARLRASSLELCYRETKEGRESIFIFLQQRGFGRFADGLFVREGSVVMCAGVAAWQFMFECAFEVLVIRLRRSRIAEPLGHRLIGPRAILAGPLLQSIKAVLYTLLHDLEHLDDDDLVSIENALLELVRSPLRQRREACDPEITQVQAAHFQRLMTIVDANLTQPGLTMRKVARMAGVSRRYLQKLFQLHSTTYSEFIRTIGLDRVRQALSQESERSASIADIAFRYGFISPSHFSRVFRAAFGISPQAYRKTAEPRTMEAKLHRGRPSGERSLSARSKYVGVSPDLIVKDLITGVPIRRHVDVNSNNVHWGFLSKNLPPVMRVETGAEVVVETLTQHASDDWERMVKGDAGAESVFHWTAEGKNVDRRGAGPMDASVLGRGAGEGFGVHILTGPIYIEKAEPGDILEVNILDIAPRPSANPDFAGRCFASNVATWWGYHYSDFIDQDDPREVVTIFEIEPTGTSAQAIFSFRWTPQTDPYGIRHDIIDYPGVPVDQGHLIDSENHLQFS